MVMLRNLSPLTVFFSISPFEHFISNMKNFVGDQKFELISKVIGGTDTFFFDNISLTFLNPKVFNNEFDIFPTV